MRFLLTLLLGLAACWPAAAAEVRVLTAGAYKGVATRIAADFEKRTGHKVVIKNDTAGGVARRIEAGEAFDVVVMPPARMAPLLGNRLESSSAKPLARSGIGVAIKPGTPAPDLSSVESWKQALLAAPSIAYVDPASGGTSGVYLAGLFERMGIADQLRGKTVLVKGGLVAEKLVSGEAALAMQQISELMAVPGVIVVGPLPLDAQSYTIYAGAISAAASDRAAAEALMLAFSDPATFPVLQKLGLDAP